MNGTFSDIRILESKIPLTKRHCFRPGEGLCCRYNVERHYDSAHTYALRKRLWCLLHMKVQRILLNDFHLPMSGCLLNSLLSGFRRLMNVACSLPFHFRYFRQRYVSEQVADGTPNIRVFPLYSFLNAIVGSCYRLFPFV